jgi:PadR family transcriptional regulator PadR
MKGILYAVRRYIGNRNMYKNDKTNPLPAVSPLSEAVFLILLSLVPGRKHGYAILKDVEDLSAGAVRLSTSTLYGALSRLEEAGLVARVDSEGPAAPAPGLPRKFYELTEAGRGAMEAETRRMRDLVRLAGQRLGEYQAPGGDA